MKGQHVTRCLIVMLTLWLSLFATRLAGSQPEGLTHPVYAEPGVTSALVQAAPWMPQAAGDAWYAYANGDDVLALAMEGSILWAGTRAGGVVRWDTRDGTYVQYLKPQDWLAGNTVRDIFIDPQGHKWFATDEGLSVLDDNGTAEKSDDIWYTYNYWAISAQFPSSRITAVAMDEAGFLWLGTSQYWDPGAQAYVGGGLVKIDTKGTLIPADDEWLQTYTVTNTMSIQRDDIVLGLASDNITDILPVPGNRVWVATRRHLAFRQLDPEDPGQWVQIYGGLSRLDHAGTPEMEDDTWQTWTCEDGPQHNPKVSCTINQLRLDANGYVWAAQRGRGVIAFPYDAPSDVEPVQFAKSDGLPTSDIESLTFGPADDPQWRNTVWLGIYNAVTGYGRGVAVLDHKGTISDKADDTWNEKALVPDEYITTESGLPGNRVQTMLTGGGKVWMGIGGPFGKARGISALDLSQQVLQPPLTTASSGLPYNYITDLAVGQEGTRWENQVWVATGNKRGRKYGVGALLLNTQGTPDPADDTWTQFTKENTDDNHRPPWTGLASDNVTAVAIAGDDVLFGTQPATWEAGPEGGKWTDGGLSIFDGERWTVRTAEGTGLRSNTISALAIGCQGEVWIALGNQRDNSGAGIDVLDPRGDPHDLTNDHWWTPIVYPTIPSNLVTGFAPDCARGYMWVSAAPYFTGFGMHGGGVARYDYATGSWTSWTSTNWATVDGVNPFAPEQVIGEIQSIAVGPDGKVWTGGWGGRDLSRQTAIDNWPYIPAVINWFWDGRWSSQVFEHDGWISSIAIDANRTVWAGTSRGGLDFDVDGKPDDKLAGRAIGGVHHTVRGTQWDTWTPENAPLVTNDIQVIKVGPEGDVWAGTNGWGLMRFLEPLPVIRLVAEMVLPTTVFEVGETSEVEVMLHNNNAELSVNTPRFRLRIEQDPSAPVLEPAVPTVITQPIVVEPGSSTSVTFTLRAVRAGTVTLDLEVFGEVGPTSDIPRHTRSVAAQPVRITVIGKSYLPLIAVQTMPFSCFMEPCRGMATAPKMVAATSLRPRRPTSMLLGASKGAATPHRVYLPLIRRPPLTVLPVCLPQAGPRPDALIIADGILHRKTDELLIDPGQRRELASEIERVLALIRQQNPAVADIHADDRYVPGRLVLGPSLALRSVIESVTATRSGPFEFKTGYEGFDELNHRLGLRGVELNASFVTLCFNDHLNVPAASVAYSALNEVRHAVPSFYVGDWPDIAASQEGAMWYVVFRDAWGDCPAGCTEEELFFFTVAGDNVTAIEPSQALADPHFQELISLVRHQGKPCGGC